MKDNVRRILEAIAALSDKERSVLFERLTHDTGFQAATQTTMALERRIVQFPEVEETVSRIGRPEAGSHPHPVNYAEIHIELKPLAQ